MANPSRKRKFEHPPANLQLKPTVDPQALEEFAAGAESTVTQLRTEAAPAQKPTRTPEPAQAAAAAPVTRIGEPSVTKSTAPSVQIDFEALNPEDLPRQSSGLRLNAFEKTVLEEISRHEQRTVQVTFTRLFRPVILQAAEELKRLQAH